MIKSFRLFTDKLAFILCIIVISGIAVPVYAETGNISNATFSGSPDTAITRTPIPVVPDTSVNISVSFNESDADLHLTHPIMHFTKEQLDEIQVRINAAPKYSAPRQLATQSSPAATYKSLLSYLPYIASERNQGTCGNCWVWASTGLLEIAHNLDYGISDRLSVQYFDAKYYSEGNNACGGGWLYNFTDWYNSDRSPIPWTNTNASYADASTNEYNPPGRLISAISTSPGYTLNSISYSTIETDGVSNDTAIANIKSALDSGKAVEYSFFMNRSGWSAFNSFWSSGASTAIFDPSPYPGTYGGHAVIIVGYDTTDSSNPYWIVVNSWGTTTNRPDGTFRLNMNLNYSGYDSDTLLNTFQILDSEFSGTDAAPVVGSVSPQSGPAEGGTSVIISGTGFTNATAVKFGSSPATSYSITSAAAIDSQITATAPAGTAGTTANISVTTLHGTSAVSVASQYVYNTSPFIPVITDISPISGTVSGGTSVTITGTNLSGATAVTFGSIPATAYTVISNTQINATSPAQTAGTVDVIVTTPNGTSMISTADQYTYVSAPTITRITPTAGPAIGGTVVTLTGTSFTGAMQVMFGMVPNATGGMTVNNDSCITVTCPAGAAGSTANITVTTPGGTSATTTSAQFTYQATPTVMTGIGVFRSSIGGYWYLSNSNGTLDRTVTFGKSGDIPVTGDWNGAGQTEIGIFRPSTGYWFLDTNNDGVAEIAVHFGKNGDTPVVGDWDNAGHSEIGVFRSSTGNWYLNNNFVSDSVYKGFHFGTSTDTPVVGDWDNAGHSEIGVFRSSTGNWYADYNFDGVVDASTHFGKTGDIPVVGDWNNAGYSEIGVFRSSTGYWYVNYAFDGTVDDNVKFGTNGDLPIVPSTGSWV